MSDYDKHNRTIKFLNKLNLLERHHMIMADKAENRKLRNYCRKNAAIIRSFKTHLNSNFKLTGQAYLSHPQLLTNDQISCENNFSFKNFDNKFVIEIIELMETSILKDYRAILEDVRLPSSTKKLLIEQVKIIRKGVNQVKGIIENN